MSLRQPITETPANLEWRSDDGSTLVSIPPGVVDSISGYVAEAHKSVPRRGAEAGGLLVGGVRIGPVTEIFITGFEPVVCDYLYGPSFILSDAVQADFRAVTGRHPAGEILGYYRSHTRSGFGLEASDRELVARIFPGMSGLILLVKPVSPLNLTGSYFFFQRGNLEMRRVGPDFSFAGSVPGGVAPPARFEPDPPEPAPVRSNSFELAADPLPAVVEQPPVEIETTTRRRKSLQWEIVAAGFMIAAALGLLWWQYRGDSAEEIAATSRSTNTRVASLGLGVQPGEGGWRISWDPGTQAAHDSVRGVLNVTEPASHERILLTAEQIRAGSATYRPVGDDITFRLDLQRPDKSISSETYRVLLKAPETASRTAPAERKSSPPPPAAESSKPAVGPEPASDESYVEPEVVNRVTPDVPEGIRPRITAPQSIDVRVSIDRNGHVTSATPLQRGDGLINYLGERAVLAARKWTFKPARQGGKPVTSSRTIHFVFEQ